jgi:alkylation response protein AidB-like acyl-CoA dehydrogenase
MRKLPKRMQNKLYRDIYIPKETLRLRRKYREFTEKELFPIAYDLGQIAEDNENFPTGLFKSMARKGFFKVAFSKKDGGLGLKYPAVAAAVLSEELAYISASFAGSVNAHYLLCGKSLSFGSRFIKNNYLIPLLNGQLFGSFAMTEPQSGSDVRPQTLITKARRRGDRYIVNGQKRYITNAGVADFTSTLVSLDGKSCMLVIDLNSKGCRVSEPDKKQGNRGELTHDFALVLSCMAEPASGLTG